MVAAVVLSAGAGRRAGGPKALLLRDGETYLATVVDVCRRAGCDRVWATTRPGLPPLEAEVLRVGAVPVLNPRPEEGMFSSVQRGLLAALAGNPVPKCFVIFPVDHPEVTSRTVSRLLEALEKDPSVGWCRPAFQGRGGHPVVVTGGVARALAADPDPGRPLREALRNTGSPLTVDVEDSGVVKNVNTPEDL